jgi:16S rRNA (guanine527-N7)-methyltransferase
MSRDKNHYKDRPDEPSSIPTKSWVEGAETIGIPVENHTLEKFGRYQNELIEWNERVNLTSITSPGEIQRRHFLDSLSCIAGARDLLALPGCNVVDIGSGAGFPGLPLALVMPHLRVTLVETRGKRATFLRHLLDVLEIENVTVISERAEILGHDIAHRERYDVTVARALGPLPLIAELCMPLARIGGRCIAPRREDFKSESVLAQPAFDLVGGSALQWIPVNLPELDDGRGLVIAEKVSPTPDRFPRRPGMPAKRPLT